MAAAGALDAPSPHRIPFRGWIAVLRRAVRHVLSDRLQVASAGIAFFAVLSVAPLLVTALSVYGTLNAPEQARAQLSRAAGMLPDQLRPVVTNQLGTIATASTHVLSLRGLSGLVFALWTAITAATYLVDALTLAYSETETRSLVRRSGIGVLMVVGGALLLGAVLAAAGAGSRFLAGLPSPAHAVAHVLIWPVLAAGMAGVLAVLYRFAPDRKGARWRWISGGATLATLLWLVSTMALFAWVQHLGDYRSTYGSLAGVVISMFWLWITVFLVLLGAAVNAEAERQTARDSTVGPDQPEGERGAAVADSAPVASD